MAALRRRFPEALCQHRVGSTHRPNRNAAVRLGGRRNGGSALDCCPFLRLRPPASQAEQYSVIPDAVGPLHSETSRLAIETMNVGIGCMPAYVAGESRPAASHEHKAR